MTKNKKIVLGIVLGVLIVFLSRFLINLIIVFAYNKGDYNELLIKVLYPLNISERYIVYYNDGNINYQNNKYDEAISYYKKALEKKPPKKKVCAVRINLALATISNIKATNKEEILKELELAKSYLYEDNCASSDGSSGDSEEAEALKIEIEKLEEETRNGNSNNGSSVGENEEENTSNDEKSIEEQLKENQKQANSSRQESIQTNENLDNYEYYSGKRW